MITSFCAKLYFKIMGWPQSLRSLSDYDKIQYLARQNGNLIPLSIKNQMLITALTLIKELSGDQRIAIWQSAGNGNPLFWTYLDKAIPIPFFPCSWHASMPRSANLIRFALSRQVPEKIKSEMVDILSLLSEEECNSEFTEILDILLDPSSALVSEKNLLDVLERVSNVQWLDVFLSRLPESIVTQHLDAILDAVFLNFSETEALEFMAESIRWNRLELKNQKLWNLTIKHSFLSVLDILINKTGYDKNDKALPFDPIIAAIQEDDIDVLFKLTNGKPNDFFSATINGLSLWAYARSIQAYRCEQWLIGRCGING